MSDPSAGITIPVDLTNPGQFLACCGLFELADRLGPGAEAWFTLDGLSAVFQISATSGLTLSALLDTVRSIEFDVGTDADDQNGAESDATDKTSLEPIQIESPIRLVLDWWSDKSIKPWAGSMNERRILYAMLKAIDPADPDPLNNSKAVFDPAPKQITGKRANRLRKREPFYFDCRRSSNAHPLDSGFSPDVHHMTSTCFPVVEALCFVGLQRARPASTGVPNQSRFTAWTQRLPVNSIGPVVCGLVHTPESLTFSFINFFRTDQKKHKSFSRATRERTNDA